VEKLKYAMAAVTGLLVACGGAPQDKVQPVPTAIQPAEDLAAEPQAPERPADLPWWQGESPLCSEGELKRRNLSWGSVFWCASAGVRVDQSLQSDLSRLARCVQESVGAYQYEPEVGKLGDFLARAKESGMDPVLCGAVRNDSEVRTYHGRRVLMERRLESDSATELGVRYRFGCEGCGVASETTATISKSE